MTSGARHHLFRRDKSMCCYRKIRLHLQGNHFSCLDSMRGNTSQSEVQNLSMNKTEFCTSTIDCDRGTTLTVMWEFREIPMFSGLISWKGWKKLCMETKSSALSIIHDGWFPPSEDTKVMYELRFRGRLSSIAWFLPSSHAVVNKWYVECDVLQSDTRYRSLVLDRSRRNWRQNICQEAFKQAFSDPSDLSFVKSERTMSETLPRFDPVWRHCGVARSESKIKKCGPDQQEILIWQTWASRWFSSRNNRNSR